MSSTRLLTIGALYASSWGCISSQEPPSIIELDGKATVEMMLVAPLELVSREALGYRWGFLAAPSLSHEEPPTPIESNARFTPDVRGDYTIDRWIVLGLGEYHTHRFLVHVDPALPVAIAVAERDSVRTGELINLDGSMSYSPENLPLRFRWIVEAAPAGSPYTLPDPYNPAISFYANGTGQYVVRLQVSDTSETSTVAVSVDVVF